MPLIPIRWAARFVKAQTLLLFALIALAGGTACAASPRNSASSEAAVSAETGGQLREFVADPAARISPAEWDALREQVLALPGARVEADGPLLVSVNVGPPSTPEYYLFTTPRHPAHPAFLRAAPGRDDPTETRIEAGFAGSQEEYEKFVRAFLAHRAASQ